MSQAQYISSIEQPSIDFMKNDVLQVQESKTTEVLFAVTKHPQKPFKNYIARFEASLLTVIDPNQGLMLRPFKKELLGISKSLKDHPLIDALDLALIKSKQGTKVFIFKYVKTRRPRIAWYKP